MQNMMDGSDPVDYKSEFTWNDPKVLYQETLDRLNKKPGFLGSMLGAVTPGRIYNATRLKDEKLAIEYFKKHGGASEEKIATLQDLWDKKAERALGSTEGGPLTGAIIDGWQRGLVSLEEEYGDDPFNFSNEYSANAKRIAKSLAKKEKENNPEGTPWYEQTPTVPVGQAGIPSSEQGGDRDQRRAMEALMTQAKAETDLAKKNVEYAKKTGSDENYFVGNKGGLVARPKKKNKKK
tara:strand:- start:22 stop:729 length:708 start_codon:yes stop_codon:yes gene_type:complete